jgi:hypothetical protein
MYNIHKFLTGWIFILVIFHNISSKYFSLPYLSFMVLFISLYLSYINPAKYYIEYTNNNENSIIVVDGYEKYLVDIIFHISPFIFIYYYYGFEPFFSNWKIIPSLILILIYLLIYNPSYIYHIPIIEIFYLSISSVILYIFISNSTMSSYKFN